MIQYSIIRYCTRSSTNGDNHSAKQHILKIYLICMVIADVIHTVSYLHYYSTYGTSFDLSLYLTTAIFMGRLIFLWLNYKNEKKKKAK
jgi:cytochrome c oxidase subunit IV